MRIIPESERPELLQAAMFYDENAEWVGQSHSDPTGQPVVDPKGDAIPEKWKKGIEECLMPGGKMWSDLAKLSNADFAKAYVSDLGPRQVEML